MRSFGQNQTIQYSKQNLPDQLRIGNPYFLTVLPLSLNIYLITKILENG